MTTAKARGSGSGSDNQQQYRTLSNQDEANQHTLYSWQMAHQQGANARARRRPSEYRTGTSSRTCASTSTHRQQLSIRATECCLRRQPASLLGASCGRIRIPARPTGASQSAAAITTPRHRHLSTRVSGLCCRRADGLFLAWLVVAWLESIPRKHVTDEQASKGQGRLGHSRRYWDMVVKCQVLTTRPFALGRLPSPQLGVSMRPCLNAIAGAIMLEQRRPFSPDCQACMWRAHDTSLPCLLAQPVCGSTHFAMAVNDGKYVAMSVASLPPSKEPIAKSGFRMQAWREACTRTSTKGKFRMSPGNNGIGGQPQGSPGAVLPPWSRGEYVPGQNGHTRCWVGCDWRRLEESAPRLL